MVILPMPQTTPLHGDVLLEALEAAGIGRWSWEFATGKIQWSPANERLHGLAPGTFDGQLPTYMQLVHPDDRRGLEQDVDHAIRSRKPYRRDLRIVDPEGRTRWIEAHGHVVLDGEGQPYAMVGLAVDISERKATEEELAASEERFRTFIDAEILGIGTWASNGRMETANDTLLNMLGVSREAFERTDMSWMDITPRGYEQVDAEALRQVAQHGRCEPYEKEYVRADGTRFPVLIALSRFPNDPEKGISYAIDLSAQKRRTEAKFRRLFEANIFGMAIVHKEGRVMEANDSFLALVGRPREELERGQLTRSSFISERYQERNDAALRELEQTGTSSPYEKELVRPGGDTVPVLAAAAALEGDPSEYIELVIDLTEQKQAQRSLREAEERFRVAASSASDLIYEWEIPTGVMRWYGDVERQLGYGENEFPQTFEGWTGIIHPEDRKRVLEAVDRHLFTRAPFQEEYRVLRKDGAVAYWSDRAALLYDSNGRPWRWIGVSSNVTGLRLGALALAESEDRFRKLTERVRVIPWEADARTGQFTYVGPQAADTLGYPIEHWYTSDFWPEHIHNADRQWAVEFCIEQSKAVDDYEFEYRMIAADGRVVWLYDIVNVVRDADGPRIIRGFMIDITDRKKAEEERQQALLREQQARRHAEEASRAKDEFLATVSHELRTPLTSILGWSQMLRTGGASSAETQQRAFAAIERNALAQAQLIDDILDVARIVTGKLRLDLRPLDIEPLIQSAVESVRPGAQAKGIEIILDIQRPMSLVQGDPDRLQQVLWNLLSNAIKFTAAGGTVTLRVSRENEQLCTRVIDTGAGISDDFLPHVFEPFRQADGTSRRAHGGLGLGLSIVRHLVTMHGGKVDAQSEGEGRGSTFSFTLPLLSTEPMMTPARILPRKAAPKPSAFMIDPSSFAGLRVLVVDDEADVRQLLSIVLARGGATVETATSSADAIEHLDRSEFDLMISDIGMPGEDGYTLMSRIRASSGRYAEMPAIALTAYARAEDRERALSAGFQEHLPKPVDLFSLTEAIHRLAGRVATES